MTVSSHSSLPADNGANLHFIDGSGSHSSYAAVARRGSIFLGIRFSGLTDGHQLGVPGKTYLHARMRSARDQALAVKLDLESGADNVIDLSAQQLALDEAWPAFAFEKANAERASLQIGMFINGSLIDDTDTVIARIEKAGLFRKLVEYVVERAGMEYRIVRAKVVAAWMSDHSKPMLDVLQKASVRHKIAVVSLSTERDVLSGVF